MSNPKQYWQNLDSGGAIFNSIADPIKEEIRIPEHEKIFMRGYPVIPYLYHGEATLPLLRRIARMSPTANSCIRSITSYVVGGGFDVIQKKRTGFARRTSQETEVEDSQFDEFVNWMEQVFITSMLDLSRLSKRHFLNLLKYGNGFLEVVLMPVGTEVKVAVYNHDADRCLYLAQDQPSETDYVLVSPYWYEKVVFQDQPDMIPLYPAFEPTEEGYLRTMIHTKDVVDGRDWFGEASWFSALYSAYNEVQHRQYNVESYSDDFTGRVFFETFDAGTGEGAIEQAYDQGDQYSESTQPSFWTQIRNLFTNRGNKKRSVMHRSAPMDGKETHIHEFGRNTDHEFHEVMARLDESDIIRSFQWHPALMGINIPGSLGQNQMFDQAYRERYSQVIKPWQDLQMEPFNLILKIISEASGTGQDLVEEMSLSLKNMYADSLRETSQETGQMRDQTVGQPDPVREQPATEDLQTTQSDD